MLNKLFLCLLVFSLTMTLILVGQPCFIAQEGNIILMHEGDTNTQHSPCSTFKIPLAIIGYEEGILIDESSPEWPYQEEYQAPFDMWQKSQNPGSWIQNSCIWYSQVLTQKLGMEKLQYYVDLFTYGNQNISGDAGKDNGLIRAWLGSSLKISAQEQIDFLQKLVNAEFLPSFNAVEKAQKLFYIEELNGWQLYGKTGTGWQINADGSYNTKQQMGWFVGWLSQGSRHIVFAAYIEDDKEEITWAGERAKEEAKTKLIWFTEPRGFSDDIKKR